MSMSNSTQASQERMELPMLQLKQLAKKQLSHLPQQVQLHLMPTSLGQTLRVLKMLPIFLFGIILLLAISYLVALSLAMLMLQVILTLFQAVL
ncbi:MAG: hypothetical protein EBR82_81215 [Caulobacteraceae bacterium]|nr:hypothetical protein [Caulobacteraceae bacterium]